MKRVALFLLILASLISFTACKKNDSNSENISYNIDELYKVAKENMDTSQMNDSDAEMIDALMQIKSDEYDEMKYMAPATNLNTNQILIIKTNETIDNKIDEYLKNQIELYSSYLPEEAEKLKKAEKFNLGNYTILLVGNSEDEANKTRKAMEK